MQRSSDDPNLYSLEIGTISEFYSIDNNLYKMLNMDLNNFFNFFKNQDTGSIEKE